VKKSYAEKLEVPYLRLPERMAPTSADVIATLNEHLIEVLEELETKETEAKALERGLGDAKREMAVIAQKQALWYREHKDVSENAKKARAPCSVPVTRACWMRALCLACRWVRVGGWVANQL
jgi:hypothetical protein